MAFSSRTLPLFLNTGTTDEIFKQSGKQDSFSHILKNSTSMYEVCMKFQVQSSLEPLLEYNQDQLLFDESRFTMIFLIILRDMEIL